MIAYDDTFILKLLFSNSTDKNKANIIFQHIVVGLNICTEYVIVLVIEVWNWIWILFSGLNSCWSRPWCFPCSWTTSLRSWRSSGLSPSTSSPSPSCRSCSWSRKLEKPNRSRLTTSSLSESTASSTFSTGSTDTISKVFFVDFCRSRIQLLLTVEDVISFG